MNCVRCKVRTSTLIGLFQMKPRDTKIPSSSFTSFVISREHMMTVFHYRRIRFYWNILRWNSALYPLIIYKPYVSLTHYTALERDIFIPFEPCTSQFYISQSQTFTEIKRCSTRHKSNNVWFLVPSFISLNCIVYFIL